VQVVETAAGLAPSDSSRSSASSSHARRVKLQRHAYIKHPAHHSVDSRHSRCSTCRRQQEQQWPFLSCLLRLVLVCWDVTFGAYACSLGPCRNICCGECCFAVLRCKGPLPTSPPCDALLLWVLLRVSPCRSAPTCWSFGKLLQTAQQAYSTATSTAATRPAAVKHHRHFCCLQMHNKNNRSSRSSSRARQQVQKSGS
jgi:hypothetical protein